MRDWMQVVLVWFVGRPDRVQTSLSVAFRCFPILCCTCTIRCILCCAEQPHMVAFPIIAVLNTDVPSGLTANHPRFSCDFSLVLLTPADRIPSALFLAASKGDVSPAYGVQPQ
jgi:hypothetical protein